VALLVALSFPYNAFMITKHGKLKNAQGFSNVHATRKFRAIKHSGIWTRGRKDQFGTKRQAKE
jgi:hypothetical protein